MSDSSDLQISLLLKGDDARRFREFKARERLMKDAEAGRKLILDRLADLEDGAASNTLLRRKPNARAEMKRVLLETLRDVLEEAS